MNEHRGLSMRTQRGVVSFIALLLVLAAIDAPAQQKLAQTGMKFLNVLPDARAAALGEAMTSVEGPASSLFFNTASMGRMTGLSSVFVSHTQWIADIKHMYAAAAFSPFDGEYGVIGFNFPVPASLPKGFTFFAQAQVTFEASDGRYTNSVPLVVR